MIKESQNQISVTTQNSRSFISTKIKKDIVDFQDPEDREIIIKVLKNQNHRSKYELEFLRKAFQHLKFFQEKAQQFSEQAQLNLYQSLNFQHVPRNNILFHYGDDGDTYYIILKGSISVMLPKSSLRNKIKKGKVSREQRQSQFETCKILFQRNFDSESYKDNLSNKQDHASSRRVSVGFNLTLQLSNDIQKIIKEEDEPKFKFQKSISMKKFKDIPEQNNVITLDEKQSKCQNLQQLITSESVQAFSNVKYSQVKVRNRRRESLMQNNLEMETQAFQEQVFPEYDCMKILKAGEAFGEIALVSNEKRTATIFVREDTDFATINRYQFQQILKDIQENIRYSKIKEIKKFKGLDLLTYDQLEDAIRVMQIKKYHIHQVIYREHSDSEEVYFINSGSIELSTSYQDNRIKYNTQISSLISNQKLQSKIPATHDGRVRVATILEKEVFGWEEILNNQQRIYTAQALEALEIYILPKQVIFLKLNQRKNEAFKSYFEEKNQVLRKYRHEMVDQSVKQKSNLEVISDRALALTLKNLHIKQQQPGPILKIFSQGFQEKFKEVSHIHQMANNTHILEHRVKNFSQILQKEKIQQSLLENPMFLVPQKQLLDKRHQEIRRQFSVMRGEEDERMALVPNYIYTSPNIHSTKDLNQSNLSKMTRSEIKFKSMLDFKRSNIKLPSIDDSNTQRDTDFSMKLVALVSPKSMNNTPGFVKSTKAHSTHVGTQKGKNSLFTQTCSIKSLTQI